MKEDTNPTIYSKRKSSTLNSVFSATQWQLKRIQYCSKISSINKNTTRNPMVCYKKEETIDSQGWSS
ncbi:unnamed protein product [Rotaria magnacalcarata]